MAKCYIAAPAGVDLGALPDVLSDRAISWEWAKGTANALPSPSEAIIAADFLIGIVDGSRSDSQVFYEVGLAAGLGKPVLLIAKGRKIPSDLRQFQVAKVPLKDRRALGLHIDIFLKTPKRELEERSPSQRTSAATLNRLPRASTEFHGTVSELEDRAYNIVEACGGRAIAQPSDSVRAKYRPDLLAWLGHQDAELLDPTVIEIRRRVYPKDMRQIEEQLLVFMQATGIRTAFVLTAESPPQVERQLSPYIYWLTLDEFEALARQSKLGTYVRETRNRVMHGAR
jgi:hypothetical protein